MRKGQPTNFQELAKAELRALQTLPEEIITPLVLFLTRLTGTYALETDVCDRQVGCDLPQKQPEESEEPSGYWSRSFHDTEWDYDITHKECLPVVWAVLLLRQYVVGV